MVALVEGYYLACDAFQKYNIMHGLPVTVYIYVVVKGKFGSELDYFCHF